MTKKLKFEEAFQRLEEILTTMNSANIELEEALGLYEEADQLIELCSSKLKNAEQKIEVLIKKRNEEKFETKDFENV
jgi:exodeoxyribonuclease VII small subunit